MFAIYVTCLVGLRPTVYLMHLNIFSRQLPGTGLYFNCFSSYSIPIGSVKASEGPCIEYFFFSNLRFLHVCSSVSTQQHNYGPFRIIVKIARELNIFVRYLPGNGIFFDCFCLHKCFPLVPIRFIFHLFLAPLKSLWGFNLPGLSILLFEYFWAFTGPL